ncbi:MAG: YbjN domain-containing protein [Myxococcota bacterium]
MSSWNQLVLAMKALGLEAEFLDPDGPVVAETTPGLLGLVAWAHPERGDVCVTETLVPSVPSARARAVRDFVLRANHHLTAGTIDFDLDERRLNYRVGLHGASVDPTLVARTIEECLTGMHRVIDPLLEVVEGTHASDAADGVFVPRGIPRGDWISDVAVLAEAMRSLDLEVDVLEDNGMCQAILHTPDGVPALGCLAWVEPEKPQLCVTTMLPQAVPWGDLDAVAEFVLRVNHRFSTGGFDLDLDDGGFRHRVGLIYRRGELRVDLAAVVVREALDRMTAVIDPLTRVFEGCPPAEAALDYP